MGYKEHGICAIQHTQLLTYTCSKSSCKHANSMTQPNITTHNAYHLSCTHIHANSTTCNKLTHEGCMSTHVASTIDPFRTVRSTHCIHPQRALYKCSPSYTYISLCIMLNGPVRVEAALPYRARTSLITSRLSITTSTISIYIRRDT